MNISKRLFFVFMSVLIILISVYQISFVSYAFSWEHAPIKELYRYYNNLETETEKQDFLASLMDNIISGGSFVASSLGAIVNGSDFSQFMKNYEAYKNYVLNGSLTENVTISQDNTITFSEDLTACMKQALIEYAEETNGFKLIATTDYHDLSASDFASGYVYHSFRNIVHENGLVAVTGGGVSGNVCKQSLSFAFFLPFDKDSIKNNNSSGSVSLVKASGYNSPYYEKALYYDSLSWDWLNYTVYDCKVYYNTDEGHTAYKVITSFDECEEKTSGLKTDFQDVGYSYIGWNPVLNFSKNFSGYFLYSTDGRKLKVFNSLNALKNYTTGDRSVYFGSGFYDDPGEIQVSFDDLEKYIDGKYDSFFDDLKDLIGDNEDNLTEEDLEKLVDKILDKMDDIGGNNKPGDNTGDNSGILDGIADILEGITSAISGYLDAILMYLESILTDLDYIVLEMQDMTEEEVSTKSDSVISELSDAFSEIGDVMSQKFPFSIPWDIKNLYVALSGGKEPGIQSLSDDIGIGGLYHDSSPPSASSGKLIDVIVYPSPDDGTMPLVADEDMGNITPVPPSGDASFTDSGAPVFKIPFVIRSAGVNAAVLLDMSYFDTVSAFSRTLFLLIFLHQLFLLSMRVFEFVKSFMG